jgi:hypothetical protein
MHTTTTCVKAATPIYTDGDQQLDQSRRSTLHLQIKPHHTHAKKYMPNQQASIAKMKREFYLPLV